MAIGPRGRDEGTLLVRVLRLAILLEKKAAVREERGFSLGSLLSTWCPLPPAAAARLAESGGPFSKIRFQADMEADLRERTAGHVVPPSPGGTTMALALRDEDVSGSLPSSAAWGPTTLRQNSLSPRKLRANALHLLPRATAPLRSPEKRRQRARQMRGGTPQNEDSLLPDGGRTTTSREQDDLPRLAAFRLTPNSFSELWSEILRILEHPLFRAINLRSFGAHGARYFESALLLAIELEDLTLTEKIILAPHFDCDANIIQELREASFLAAPLYGGYSTGTQRNCNPVLRVVGKLQAGVKATSSTKWGPWGLSDQSPLARLDLTAVTFQQPSQFGTLKKSPHNMLKILDLILSRNYPVSSKT